MRQKGMKKFVLRTLVALLPVFAFVALYLCLDPFRVVYRYDGVSVQPGDTLERIPNKRFVALEGFKHYNPTEHFDSFIFGSSLSSNYTAAAWKKYLPDSASVYHFTVGAQTLTGIRDELQYLINHGVKVRHALLVMEEEMYRRPKRYEEMPFLPHPEVSPEMSWLHFHRVHFNALRDPDMLLYNLWPTEEVANRLLADAKINKTPCARNEVMNEDYSTALDTMVINHPDEFFADVPWLVNMIPNPDPQPLSIGPEAEALLRDIRRLLDENHVDYIVIVPPRYRVMGLSGIDHVVLCEIMGKDHVFDYSCDNELMNDLQSYYDGMHMLTHRCTELIDRAYHNSPIGRTL